MISTSRGGPLLFASCAPFYIRPLFPLLSPCNIKNRAVDYETAGATPSNAKKYLGLGCVTLRSGRMKGISTPSPPYAHGGTL